MTRRKENTWLLMLCLIACFAPITNYASGTQDGQPTVIALTPYLGTLPSMKVTVAGHDATFLLDTAGGLSVVTPQFAKSLGCEPWGQLTGFRMRGERLDLQHCDNVHLQLSGTPLDVPVAGVWDLAKILPKGAPILGGSLALDAFAGHAVTLDLSAGILIMETSASLKTRIRHATEVPVRFSREVEGLALTPLVAVQTSRGTLWMEIDSGSDAAMIINRPVAEALHLNPDAKGLQKINLMLADRIPLQSDAQVENLILDGNIGAPVLKHWIVTIDLVRRRLWIANKVHRGGEFNHPVQHS